MATIRDRKRPITLFGLCKKKPAIFPHNFYLWVCILTVSTRASIKRSWKSAPAKVNNWRYCISGKYYPHSTWFIILILMDEEIKIIFISYVDSCAEHNFSLTSSETNGPSPNCVHINVFSYHTQFFNIDEDLWMQIFWIDEFNNTIVLLCHSPFCQTVTELLSCT